ncbi:MAG TPA: hypothetical protein VFB96_19480 [Pirellulaceae bacterium]|nr:hypothetical protein [Pirellulaceae bacterium]
MFKVCPICQQQVPVYEWAVHEMQHRGPMQAAPLVQGHSGPAALPIQQAAAKAPRIYHHPRCGHATALPDAAVYAQLQDPFRSSDQAYCSGCKGYVHNSELFWEGTSESLLASDRRQKAEYIRAHALNPNDFVWDATGPVRRKSQTNWGMIVGVGIGGVALVLLLGVGLVIALVVNSVRSAAARREPFAAPAAPAGLPIVPQPVGGAPFGQANDFGDVRIRQDDVFEQMRKQQEDIRKQHDQMIKDLQDKLRAPGFAEPPGLEPPQFPGSGLPGFGGSDPAADARRRIEELRQDSQRRVDEIRERSRQRQEEIRQRMERNRPQFP